ncbi:IS256 family transposase, partial [Streptobacillus canis]|uniref:IS256 family transposase n=1 Tax=Streptobacillus canis TaxID=2678686 RepID=UPI0012E11D28
YVILGIDINGKKDVLSIEIGDAENSKLWLSVLSSLKARGVKDILILCSDRLTGIKEAITAVYPQTDWQGCIIHQIRNTLRFVSYKHKKDFMKDLKLIYTSNTEEEAKMQLDIVAEKWNRVYKGCMDRWYDNWENISPMFSYGEELRKIVYTTNSIESLNSSYKRINKGRVVFPSKTSLFKSLYLATEIITKKWSQPIRNWGQIYMELIINFGRESIEI